MTRDWNYCPGVPVTVSGKPGVVMEDPAVIDGRWSAPDKVLVRYTDGSTKIVGYRKLRATA